MRKIALIAATCFAATTVNAQYADIGVHGAFGTTWMINSNISDQGSNLDPEFSTAPMFGIHMNYSINKTLGIKTEINYAQINQKYKGVDGSDDFKAKDRNTYLELPILLELHSGAFYAEVGPKFSFLTGARTDASATISGASFEEKNLNVKQSYNNAFVSAVLGVGGNFQLSKGWYLNTGLRFSWGLGDATRDFSLLNEPENMSVTTMYAHTDQKGNFSYKKTNVATGAIIIGISRRFPY